MTPPKLNRSMLGEPDADYTKALTACQGVGEVQALVREFAELAVDAVPLAEAMTEADWPEFQRGLKSERRGQFAGEAWMERFGAILVPLPMMTITQIAAQYAAPFGVTWYRCKEIRPDLLKVTR